MNVGSLFSGIGGFDLGLERAGLRTVWFCEQDAYCQRVLARHWPGVPCYDDVRALVAHADSQRLSSTAVCGQAADRVDHGGDESLPGRRVVPVPVPPVDVLCGGFPCQDLSYAGAGAGLDGARSGLWSEYARLVGELRPRYVVVENVSALLARGMGRVLGDLAALGYDAEWDCIPASALGAPHRRDRVWIVAYPHSQGPQGHGGSEQRAGELAAAACGSANRTGTGLADTDSPSRGAARSAGQEVPRSEAVERLGRRGGGEGSPWAAEPDVGRVAHGVPARVDRLRSLGNALVPQIAEWIGHRIVSYEEGCVTSV